MNQGQQYLKENRPGRVQIAYETNINGAQQRVELPFVVGVMADLSGNAGAPRPDLEDRKFHEVSANKLDSFMRDAVQPRVQFAVPNELTGEGNLAVDLSLKSMDDFDPGSIARNVEPLRKLFEAREQLQQLVTMLGGKAKAEKFVDAMLRNPGELDAVLRVLSSGRDAGDEPSR